jgi:dynein heavy chain
LHKQGVNTEKIEKEMKDIMEKFGAVKKQAPNAAEVIKPVQEREADKIKAEVEKFTLKVKIVQREFNEKPFMSNDPKATEPFESIVESKYKSVVEMKAHLREIDKELGVLIHFATVFEFLEITEEAVSVVKGMHSDLNTMLQLWHFISMVDFQMAVWNKTLWAAINTEMMEDGTKTIFKQLRAQDKVAKSSNAFSVLEGKIKGFLTTLPLVADLSHRSMRKRHWDLLRDLTRKQFDETSKEFILLDLTNLHLDEFEDDVGEIVNRAQKEEKMEQALEKIGTVWKTLEFQFVQHKSTDIMMLKLSEEDFETLEDHQLQVQNMMGSRYLATFEKQVTTWQKNLSSVADVVQIMAEIQRTWAYLETLFIGSEEVKKELPEDAAMFANIDVGVKETLKEIFSIKNSVRACEKEGLYKELEKMQSELQMCEKSLANYLEQKRRKFPRFYFVSTTDLLDILSNGNDPSKVLIPTYHRND